MERPTSDPEATSEIHSSGSERPLKMPAPDFRLEDADGQQVTLAQFRGRLVFLHFFRHVY
jgi:cytochrome oxidase Cu insertion factor (SCO1/SenC/PrrC family)